MNHTGHAIFSQALAAFEARLETDELLAYKTEMENLINAPQEELVNFVNQVFDPFCATLKKEGVYSQLEDEARYYETGFMLGRWAFPFRLVEDLIGDNLGSMCTHINQFVLKRI